MTVYNSIHGYSFSVESKVDLLFNDCVNDHNMKKDGVALFLVFSHKENRSRFAVGTTHLYYKGGCFSNSLRSKISV